MGFILRDNRAFVPILTLALLWASIAWGLPWNRINQELEPPAAELIPLIEYDPLTYERSTDGDLLAGVFDVASAGETWTCPACGHENKTDANFCVKCGAPRLEDAPGNKIYCPKCGAASPEGSKFCTACGYALEEIKPGVAAAGAPPENKISICITVGRAVYGEIELDDGSYVYDADLGLAWHIGGGFTIPIRRRAGTANASIELTTDTGYTVIHREAYGVQADFKMVPTRESVVLNNHIGSKEAIKLFAGLGAGVNVMLWNASYIATEIGIGSGSEVKPLLAIPAGCEFKLTPDFGLAVRVEYLFILGTFDAYDPVEENTYRITIPDLILFGAAARVGF
jgi:hypothetical protein